MVSTAELVKLLKPWLGSAFCAVSVDVLERLALSLSRSIKSLQDLIDLAQQTDNTLFMTVREATNGRMTLVMDDGMAYRIRTNDFTEMADEALYLCLSQLPRTETSYRLVYEYSLRAPSLSALKALYLDFQAFQTEEEWRILRRVITGCHPPERWRSWLDATDLKE